MLISASDLTAVGLAAALGASSLAGQAQWRPDIRSECLCWAVILVILRIYSITTRHRITREIDPVLNRKLWAVSLSISSSQTLRIWFDIEPALPLVTSAIIVLSLLRTPISASLPGPVFALEPAVKSLNRSLTPRALLIESVLAVTLGIWSYMILLHGEGRTGVSFYVACATFVLLRTVTFRLLEDIRAPDPDPERASEEVNFSTIVDRVASRTLCMLAILLFLYSPQSTLSVTSVPASFLAAAEMAVTLYLVFLGSMASTTTIATFAAATVRISQASLGYESLGLCVVSILSLTQGIRYLVPPAPRRRWLLLFIVAPVLAVVGRRYDITTIASSRASGEQFRLGLSSSRDLSVHPIEQLVANAEAKFQDTLQRQSKTLEDACAEYRRRYNRDPPPHFDIWFHTAVSEGFLLVDEFDMMMRTMEPLWGVSGPQLRGRVESALANGHESMVRFAVEDNKISHSNESSAEWMAREIHGWMDDEVLSTLQDLVFAINIHDEPKVVVPRDELLRALQQRTSASEQKAGSSQRVDFINVGRQNVWEAITLSCPLDSPARESTTAAQGNDTIADIPFLSDVAASKDVCLSPELRDLHGALSTPETLLLTHTLAPVFSQARLSCFQDLLYPSPWYAAKFDSHEYEEGDDIDWDLKTDSLYWAGSTTGGHTTMQNWKSFHRQRLALMASDVERPITLMKKEHIPGSLTHRESYKWVTFNTTISEISSLLNVRITAVTQCDIDACDAQRSAFDTEAGELDPLNANYQAKYNIDVDGNSFSGRFYRALRSNSAVLKQSIFQEWHDEWLVPWVHYIPISMTLEDLPEIVRYLIREPEGQRLGQKIAAQGQEMAKRALRKRDLTVVFWRLMLEYSRIMADDRENLRCCQ